MMTCDGKEDTGAESATVCLGTGGGRRRQAECQRVPHSLHPSRSLVTNSSTCRLRRLLVLKGAIRPRNYPSSPLLRLALNKAVNRSNSASSSAEKSHRPVGNRRVFPASWARYCCSAKVSQLQSMLGPSVPVVLMPCRAPN